mmetsp:Transcript_5686/g.16090  ORF Transcript_5686/g.16090 Transcript_5686/m.16090 type:complete len:326 (+) Transcript_5686:60-1037(+)
MRPRAGLSPPFKVALALCFACFGGPVVEAARVSLELPGAGGAPPPLKRLPSEHRDSVVAYLVRSSWWQVRDVPIAWQASMKVDELTFEFRNSSCGELECRVTAEDADNHRMTLDIVTPLSASYDSKGEFVGFRGRGPASFTHATEVGYFFAMTDEKLEVEIDLGEPAASRKVVAHTSLLEARSASGSRAPADTVMRGIEEDLMDVLTGTVWQDDPNQAQWSRRMFLNYVRFAFRRMPAGAFQCLITSEDSINRAKMTDVIELIPEYDSAGDFRGFAGAGISSFFDSVRARYLFRLNGNDKLLVDVRGLPGKSGMLQALRRGLQQG